MATRNSKSRVFAILGLILIAISIGIAWYLFPHRTGKFDGGRAYKDIEYQLALGPRTPGSEAHARMIDWMKSELVEAGWKVVIQKTQLEGQTIANLIASRSDEPPKIIIGAHYDSRIVASRDTGGGNSLPVPGANDGASGVAVLLELARSLPSETVPVWLVFFDAEDNGNLKGWSWFMGSRVFVASLTEKPEAAVIIDMIGDEDLNIFFEGNSDPELSSEIWNKAEELGYDQQFIPIRKYTISDDHIPFLEAGITAIDIIDFDYGPDNSYWHTTEDTLDKVSAESLQIVGDTLWYWLTGLK